MLEATQPVALFANGLGDHLLALPALRALADLFRGRLTLVGMPGVRSLFFSDLPLRSFCEVPMESVDGRRIFDAEAVRENVREADLLLSLNPWHSQVVTQLLELLGSPPSIGFHRSFDKALPLDYSKHSSELAFDVPLQLAPALRVEDFAGPPAISADAWQRARDLRSLVPASTRVLAVHADTGIWTSDGSNPSEADVAPSRVRGSKMWPAHRFVRLLDLFLRRHSDIVVFVVGAKNLHLDRGECGSRIIPCLGLPLDTTLALVGQSDFFLGVDSCMLHAADLHRIPGVGLFGPTDCREFGFRFAPHRHVSSGTSMEGIAVDVVLDALESLVGDHPDREIPAVPACGCPP